MSAHLVTDRAQPPALESAFGSPRRRQTLCLRSAPASAGSSLRELEYRSDDMRGLSVHFTGLFGARLLRKVAVPISLLLVLVGTGSAWASGSSPGEWVRATEGAGPSTWDGSAMAYDGATGQLVMFGGYDGNARPSYSNQTWLWSGSRWSLASPAASPPAREHASMAYDPVTRQLILTGGLDGSSTPLDDTWEWDGSNWTQLSPSTVPRAVFGASMAYDPATSQLVKFGGKIESGGSTFNDTYIWTGTNWDHLSPSSYPPGRWDASMAYDTDTAQLILFGGENASYGPLDDTWDWDGSTWHRLVDSGPPFTGKPTPRFGAAMDYDTATQGLVLFGGISPGNGTNGLMDDTWSWSGSTWQQLSPPSSPPAQGNGSAAYDPRSAQLVLYGPSPTTPTSPGATWLWLPFSASPTPTSTQGTSPSGVQGPGTGIASHSSAGSGASRSAGLGGTPPQSTPGAIGGPGTTTLSDGNNAPEVATRTRAVIGSHKTTSSGNSAVWIIVAVVVVLGAASGSFTGYLRWRQRDAT